MPTPKFRRYFRHGFLPQLIAFEACVRLGSVTRAADELSLAQPTVSGLLRKLSETLGEPVLQWRGGRMVPTAAGDALCILCKNLFDAFKHYEAAQGPARGATGGRGGALARRELPVSWRV